MEIKEMRNNNMRDFRTKFDNYLQYSPVVIAYGLDALGVKSRNPVVERSIILAKGAVINYATVNILKKLTRQLRPDETTYNSWPSGHTANAFAAATFLSEEYKHRFKWMPYAAYGLASTVGALRIANNRHYISDVLAGAGFGYLSMKVAYWTHQYRWSKKHRTSYPTF
ncbi:phosphatase PAP2 family protein [Chitinophaga sedimenti]|uniref:phosphatase PAP2 family protein n=1 Tax=Chitinophaga sedimenti TaxID=2033606 RepID=UPI002005D026|nr:phosphatase PAP2 family protein [Chitinophaga sedimenti]MCK7554287.1 phosphatase PAP2 family protein [Chitinophaga sedimenti]